MIKRIAATLALVLAMFMPAHAANVYPTTETFMHYGLTITPVSGKPYYGTVIGELGFEPGAYGSGDSDCYFTGTMLYYPGAQTQDIITATFPSTKNSTSGRCPDYTKFGIVEWDIGYGTPNYYTYSGVDLGNGPLTGKYFQSIVWAASGNSQNGTYFGAFTSLEQNTSNLDDFAGFLTIPQTSLVTMQGSQISIAAPGLSNALGY